MHTHFQRKKACQLQDDYIELTDEIREKVLCGEFKKSIHQAPDVTHTTNISNLVHNHTIVIQYIVEGKINKKKP